MDGSFLDTSLFLPWIFCFLDLGTRNAKIVRLVVSAASTRGAFCFMQNISFCLSHDHGYENGEDSDLI